MTVKHILMKFYVLKEFVYVNIKLLCSKHNEHCHVKNFKQYMMRTRIVLTVFRL